MRGWGGGGGGGNLIIIPRCGPDAFIEYAFLRGCGGYPPVWGQG